MALLLLFFVAFEGALALVGLASLLQAVPFRTFDMCLRLSTEENLAKLLHLWRCVVYGPLAQSLPFSW